MEVTWYKSSKVGFPTSVEHVRHSDWRQVALAAPCVISFIYLVVIVMIRINSGSLESVPSHAYFLAAGPVTVTLLYELLYRLTHKRWLRLTISLHEAQMVARVREAADALGFGPDLTPLPENFPEMSNHELQAWCRSASATLQSQRRLAIRHQAGLREHQARPAT